MYFFGSCGTSNFHTNIYYVRPNSKWRPIWVFRPPKPQAAHSLGFLSKNLHLSRDATGGTALTTVFFLTLLPSSCQQSLHPAPEVFVTPIHRFPKERKNAASVWSEDVTSAGFKIYLREVTNFSGGHKHIRVVSTL